ncbi:MAG: GH3 auxin-responsive promoter family protein, partial [Burkholderiaceae bacterium]|nr:GH3 auxin-responsive promoter family protein [Burkholderiaceae bacterium]
MVCAPTATRRPDLRVAQTQWLLDCVRRNAGCAYGRGHDFERIRSVEDFRRQTPVSDYEDYAPFIERMAQGEADVLFSGSPIAFERTSGSSGAGKLLPYSAASLADFARALRPWLGAVVQRYRLTGPAYWAISPALRQVQRTPGGAPIGLPDAAYLGEDLTSAFVALSAVPPSVGAIGDLAQWRQQTWLALLRCGDLALISIWSPTFLLALLNALPDHADALSAQLRAMGEMDALRRLQGHLASGDGRALWPHLRLVSCWDDG